MKTFLISLVLFLATNDKIFSQTDEDLIKQSYQLAFGADPSSDNMKTWLENAPRPINVEQLLEQHKLYLAQNDDEQRKIIIRAYDYYFGAHPDDEVASYFNTAKKHHGMLYRQVAAELKDFLANHSDNQKAVIIKSYNDALHINPSETNIQSWMNACSAGCGYAQLMQQHSQYKPPRPVVEIKKLTSSTIKDNPLSYIKNDIQDHSRNGSITCQDHYYMNTNSTKTIKLVVEYQGSLFDSDCSSNEKGVKTEILKPGDKQLFYSNIGGNPDIISATFIN